MDELFDFINQNPGTKGLNVTIPYKEVIIPHLDNITPEAASIGAVNCISFHDGLTTGHNTDVIGFKHNIEPLLKPNMKKAMILGTGGGAKAVAYVLQELGITCTMVSSSEKGDSISYADVSKEIIEEHLLIVNTTPLGMYPDVDSFPPISYRALTGEHSLYDLIYNPTETKFLKYGKHYGAATKNGLEMLELQAEASWEIWQHYKPMV